MAGEAFRRLSSGPVNGPCVACQTPTDTQVIIRGATHGHLWALLSVGVDDADRVVNQWFGAGARIPLDTETHVRLCTACGAKGHMKPTLGIEPLPVYDFSSHG